LRAGSIFRLPSRPPQCPGATPNGETRPLGKSDFRSQCPSRLRTPKPARPCFEGQEGILGLLSSNMFVGDMSSLFSLLTFLDPATLPGTDLPLLPRFPEPVLRACNFFFQKITEPATFLPLFSKLRRVPEKLPQGLFFCFLSLFLWTCHVSVYTSGLLSVWRNHLKIKKSRPHVHRSWGGKLKLAESPPGLWKEKERKVSLDLSFIRSTSPCWKQTSRYCKWDFRSKCPSRQRTPTVFSVWLYSPNFWIQRGS
jgi:hypothetical protein